MSELPDGWDKTTLTSLIAHDGLFSDGDWVESKDQDPNGSIRLLQLADIGDGVFLNKSQRFINETKFEELRCTELYEGDVLVARMPYPLGRACLMPTLPQRCITVVDVAVIRPGSNSVSSRWLKHFLNSPDIRQAIDLLSSGTTRRRISRKNLSQIDLPLPPLNEQKRVADKLDVLLTRVDACRERLKRIPLILKRFRKAVLAAATSGELTEDWREQNRYQREWETTVLGSIGSVTGGLTKNPNRLTFTLRKPYLRVANVYANRLELDDVAEIGLTEAEFQKTLLLKGDLLIVEGNGSLDQIGRAAIWNDKIPYCVHQNHLIRWRSNGSVLPKFALFWLLSSEGRASLVELASTTTGLYTLSISKVASVLVRVPSLAEQQEIVRRIENLFAYADRLESHYQAVRTKVERLTPALLAKAFRGELVPQDPNDEPASVLLERIRAERAAQPAKPKRSQASKKPTMTKMTEESVKEAIRQLPKDKFSFDELRENLPGDYDSLKDILFALLSEAEPSLKQVFDQDERAMCFVREVK